MSADRQIIRKSLSELTPQRHNARTHSRKQIRQIAESIKHFGFLNAVLIDERGSILAGHGRIEAAKLLGMAEVPCVLVETLSETEKRAFMLADNKIAQNAGWDEEILTGELQFLLDDPKIDISVTGFDVSEVDALVEIGGTRDDFDPRDEMMPPALDGAATSRPGDIWVMGDHKVLCGDALAPANFRLLLASEGGHDLAQMVFTDPPYNVRIDGNVGGLGKIRHREFAMASGEMSRSAFTTFLATTMSNLVEFSIDGSIHFHCMDWRHFAEMQAAGEEHYSELKNLIVWVKDNGGMGTFYRSRHELIFAWKNGTAPHLNSFELGQNGRYRTNVWNYRGINSGGKSAREELALHPTVKPAAMVADAMKDCSNRGGIVLDPFCGSGTVLIAAQKTGRRARAIEIDPTYCDTAVLRWQKFASDHAILASSRETFSEVKARREASLVEASPTIPTASLPAQAKKSPWTLQRGP
jgi:DNA modification methylase